MAEESGKLGELRKQMDEDIRNRQRNQAPVNESDTEQESELPGAAGHFHQVSRSHSPARGVGSSIKPGAGKMHQPWQKRQVEGNFGATEVAQLPNHGLSTLTLALQSKFSPSRTHNNNSTSTLPELWHSTLVPTRASPTPNPRNAGPALSGSRKNIQQLALHYGKWYLEPRDFNQSMNEHKKKLLKGSIIKQEVDEETKA